MRKATLRKFAAYSVITLLVLQSCKDDSNLITPVPAANHSFTEEFDTAASALSRGWKFINVSDPIGPSPWQNGGDVAAPFFNSYSNNGSNVGFIGASYLSTSAGAGVISNWLVSPSVYMQNGDKIVFYARGWKLGGYPVSNNGVTDSTDFANRLVLSVNDFGDDIEVGHGIDPGHFTTDLVDINPKYYEWHPAPGVYKIAATATDSVIATAATIAQAFPQEWTRFEGKIENLKKPGYKRFAFRYLLDGGGNAGRGSGVGIDKVSYISIGK